MSSVERERTHLAKGSGSSRAPELEITMQRVSLVVSVIAVLLMTGGFLEFAVAPEDSLALPGAAAVPPGQLLHPTVHTLGIDLMSLGILILAMLPAIRVLLALAIYVRRHAWQNAMAAVSVLFILLLSTYIR